MRQRGVTLVETLVSMVIVAFGLVAMARLQLGMAHGADTARARSEATQHARAMVEELRGRAFADLAGGADTPGSGNPAAYLRRWTVAGSAADILRPVEVAVEWADRRGEVQEVVLRTAVARADPADGGAALIASQDTGTWMQPRGRHLAVPRDAVALPHDGRPVLAWSGPAGAALVLDASTGMVVEACAALAQQGDRPSGCGSVTAYLLEGYVEGPQLAGLQVVFDQGDWTGDAPECVWNDVTDPRTGHPMAGLRRYRCLVPAREHDADAATPPSWTGRVRLAGVEPAGAQVCRAGGGLGGGEQRPETYTDIDVSLDHQNFVIIHSGDCPPGSVPHPRA
jgi:type II secretory pathway pseudopilin PulG